MRIGLIGAPGAGKDTIASYFICRDFTRLAFADQIKKEFFNQSDINEDCFDRVKGTSQEQEIRNALWEYSSGQIAKDEMYFITPILNKAKGLRNVVITDVRTQEELSAVMLYSFQPVLVLRNYKKELAGEYQPGLGKVIPGTKIKLTQAIEFPIIWNIGSLEHIDVELDKFYYDILGRRAMDLEADKNPI